MVKLEVNMELSFATRTSVEQNLKEMEMAQMSDLRLSVDETFGDRASAPKYRASAVPRT